MITQSLFDVALVEPVQSAQTLYIVSGFASATMASQHMSRVLDALHERLVIELIVGMTPVHGIADREHRGFLALAASQQLGTFTCSYVMMEHAPVHAKVYVWVDQGRAIKAFTGSANYTQEAFSGRQAEVLVECDPDAALAYYQGLIPATVYCTYEPIDEHVLITPSDPRTPGERPGQAFAGMPRAVCPLVQRDGTVHRTAGLNWGQRRGRNPNQAYIPVPATVYHNRFFPAVEHFTVITDDDKQFLCRCAQQNGKALETPTNNGLLGEYFRGRLGLPNGAFVHTEDLLRYGRTTVEFYKTDDGYYFMDFSVTL